MSLPNNTVFYDGHCGLCDNFVQFILKIDAKNLIQFCTLQSSEAQSILPENFKDVSTVVFYSDGIYTSKSTAVLSIFQTIGGGWKPLASLRIVPRPIRDFCYDLVAKYRYLIFGRREQCRLPSEEERARFIC